jgi:hypothetical protein
MWRLAVGVAAAAVGIAAAVAAVAAVFKIEASTAPDRQAR